MNRSITPSITPEAYEETAAKIRDEVGRVIVGQRELVRDVLVCLFSEGHVLLEGVPGLGKTMLLKTLADALDMIFNRVQFTPDLMPADITGTQVLEEEAGSRVFRFRAGPVFANLVLADEINRATPKTQSALLEAMQERTVTVAGQTHALPRPFLVMATQNPIEMEGTYPLPEAQLDRFLLKVRVPFPSAEDLARILDRTTAGELPTVSAVADASTIASMIALTREVPIASHLIEHAVDLMRATHPDVNTAPEPVKRFVRFGASPRGAQALVLASKALALMDGRPNVAVDDLRTAASGALRHRLVLGYEATAEGVSADDVIAAVLDAVGEPDVGIRGAP